MTVYAERRKKVLARAKGSPAVAMTAANLFYLTDFWGGGAAIVEPEKTIVVTAPLEADRAEEMAHEAEVVVVRKWDDFPSQLSKLAGGGKIAVDDDRALKSDPGFVRMPEAFLEARRIKDRQEVDRITKASAGLDRIFEETPRLLKPGKTEWEVAAEMMKIATLEQMVPPFSDSALSPVIVASGPNGALPHSELTARKIRRGDLVVVDIFFRYLGYHSDATRTFAVGSATAEMKRDYAAVLEAQLAALDMVTPGTICGDIHSEVVSTLEKRGVAKLFNHGTGHGVGIDIHELPRIGSGTASKLAAGDVVTDEPGIYKAGKYGIRIEDTVQVGTKTKVLTKYTKELVTSG